jgi:hypothetical protein
MSVYKHFESKRELSSCIHLYHVLSSVSVEDPRSKEKVTLLEDMISYAAKHAEIKNVAKCFQSGETIITVLEGLIQILAPQSRPENIECFRAVSRLLLPTKANPQGSALKIRGGTSSTTSRLEILRPGASIWAGYVLWVGRAPCSRQQCLPW